ncbi:MAG: hypothetical protein ACOYO1_02540 [Bacteroidales bacterium]
MEFVYKIIKRNSQGKQIVKCFKTESEANKTKKLLIKKYELTRQRGFWGNPHSGIEISTNY